MTAEIMKLRVMVPNLVGKETVLINVPSSSTVLELKKLLAAEISGDLKIEDLKLIYLGRLLPDLSLLSYWLLDGSSSRVGGDVCADSDLLHLKSDSGYPGLLEKMSTHTLHLAYPPLPVSPLVLNENRFLLEETFNGALGGQQQNQLAELYSTYISLYWQSVNQSEGSDLSDLRMSDILGNTAPHATTSVPPPATISVSPPPANNRPHEAYLEVLWGLLTCLLHSFLIIAIFHFYGSLNLVKIVLASAIACLIIFLGQEALRLNEEVVEEEEEAENAVVEELVEAEQQGGTFAILVSNFSLFFSSVFPEGLHLPV